MKTEQTEKKLEQIDQKMMAVNKGLENSLIHLEMDRASFYLRFQNVAETKEDDLGEVMVGLIAEALQRDKREIINELDEVYRVQTNYAKCHHLLREVHIRFACKKVRDIIYRITRDELMIYHEKEIIMLMQVPRRIQEQRKDYRFLASLLNRKKILFRWITPEGMSITWQGKRIKVDDLDKAQELYDQLMGMEEDSSSREKLEIPNLEEQ